MTLYGECFYPGKYHTIAAFISRHCRAGSENHGYASPRDIAAPCLMRLNHVTEVPEHNQDESLCPEKAWIMRSRVHCSLHHWIVFRVA